MFDPKAIASEVAARVEETRKRIDTQTEGHKRWNRLEEALDIAAEEAINVLDDVARHDQATNISSMLAAHERYEALLEIFRNDAKLKPEADAADESESYERSRQLLEAYSKLYAVESRHRPF